MNVSVIIVNYNTKELTCNCLRSVFEQTKDIAFEVIVSDNGSRDGSVEMIREKFPQVTLIENGENLGFGKANNRAAQIACGEYLLFLNSDTELKNNAVKIFYDMAMESIEECVLGCRLCDGNNQEMSSYGCFTKPMLSILRRNIYEFFPWILRARLKQIRKRQYQKIENDYFVDFITGADLFISKRLYDSIGGFDENFFMYFEDDDLCRRCAHKGVKSRIISTPKIIHFEGASSVVKLQKILVQDKSFFYYVKKWMSCWQYIVVIFWFLLFFPLRLLSTGLTIKEKIFMFIFDVRLFVECKS